MHKKEIAIGGLLFTVGVLVGCGIALFLTGKTSVAESRPAVTQTPKVEPEECKPAVNPVVAKRKTDTAKQPVETNEQACKRLGVTEEELAELWQIAAARGETTLPSRDWVEHVYRPRKRAQSSAR